MEFQPLPIPRRTAAAPAVTPAGSARTEDRLRSLARLIGNTPMLEIELTYQGERRLIHAKAEHFNLTGSIKDRMALHILRRAYAEGRIEPGDTIAEATSGNTGIAFACVGRSLGHPVTIFMPDWMSRERVDLIHAMGATIVPVSRAQGGFVGGIRMAEEYAASHAHVFLPRQFANAANVQAHEATTGPEIWMQLRECGRPPDAFVAGVGTGGTVMGVGRYLKRQERSVRIHPLEPAESPTLSTGRHAGRHRIQGISDEFIPEIVRLDQLDPVVAVNDGDAILMAQKLAATLGIAVGISSGANFVGALKIQNELGADAVVATVFPDSSSKYLSTDLMREEPARDGYLTPDVELTGFTTLHRLCQVCAVNVEP
jgi:cysteine synthase A